MDRVVDNTILDTHVWLWLMEGDSRLSGALVDELEELATIGRLYVSSVSLWEVAHLERNGRIHFTVPVDALLEEALSTPGLNVYAIDGSVAAESARLPGEFAGDPVDRIIVASARVLSGALVTADPAMHAYGRAGHVRIVAA